MPKKKNSVLKQFIIGGLLSLIISIAAPVGAVYFTQTIAPETQSQNSLQVGSRTLPGKVLMVVQREIQDSLRKVFIHQ